MISELLASWINEAASWGKMLPKTAAEVAELMRVNNGRAKTTVFANDGTLASFAAYFNLGDLIEIGSVVTNPALRGQGFATRAVERVVLNAQFDFPDKPVYAFVNDESLGLFMKIGFRPCEFPQMARKLCTGCEERDGWPNCHCQAVRFNGRLVVSDKSKLLYAIIRCDNDEDVALHSAAELFCRAFAEKPWDESWEIEQAYEILAGISKAQSGALFVAIRRGNVIGSSGGFRMSVEEFDVESSHTDHVESPIDFTGSKIFYIDELFVDPAYRGIHIGRNLSEALLAHARSRGFHRFLLRTDINAHAARHVYRSLGFVDTGISDAKHKTRSYWVLE